MKHDFKLGVIGYGNMAEAIISGALNNSVCKKDDICIFDISAEKKSAAYSKGLYIAESVTEIPQRCKYILLSIKPQTAQDVFSAIKNCLNGNIFITIMAGVSKEKIHNSLSGIKVCRCMPNTPALIGKGMTAIDASEIDGDDRNFVVNLFNAIGNTAGIEEKYMNAVTAVSGSGPAYVYKFIEAFISSAKSLGLSCEQAKALVVNTVIGAAEMVWQSDCGIDCLIEKVCSKGGTTIEGVNSLNKNNFDDIINECVKAAYNRAEELSGL